MNPELAPELDIELEQWKADKLIGRAAWAGFLSAGATFWATGSEMARKFDALQIFGILLGLLVVGLSWGVLRRIKSCAGILFALSIPDAFLAYV